MKNKHNKQLLPGLSICLFASFLTGCNKTQGSSTPSNIATQRANVPSNENNEGNATSALVDQKNKKENAKNQQNNEEGTDTKTDKKSTPVPSEDTKNPEKLATDIEKNHKIITEALDISEQTWSYMTVGLNDIRKDNPEKNERNRKINEWINNPNTKDTIDNHLEQLEKAQEANKKLQADFKKLETINNKIQLIKQKCTNAPLNSNEQNEL